MTTDATVPTPLAPSSAEQPSAEAQPGSGTQHSTGPQRGAAPRSGGGRTPHVAMAVVNLPAEKDRRVIRECKALEEAGYRVTVICPRGAKRLATLPGTRSTRLRTFPQPFAGTGVLSFAVE